VAVFPDHYLHLKLTIADRMSSHLDRIYHIPLHELPSQVLYSCFY